MPAHGSNNGSEGPNTTLVNYNMDDIHAVYISTGVSSIMGVKIRDVMRTVYDPTDLHMYQTDEYVSAERCESVRTALWYYQMGWAGFLRHHWIHLLWLSPNLQLCSGPR